MSNWRHQVVSYRARFGSRRTVGHDLKAGLALGVESVPDGLAAGLLAGVNPLHGLYGYLVGTLGGALATGSYYMTVQATGAMAVIISDVPETQSGAQAGTALAALTLMAGAVMLLLGVFKAGRLVRFVPTAVLVGFINAVALNIICAQLDTFTGYDSKGANRIIKAVDTALHVASFSGYAVVTGALTIVLIVVLERTRLGALGLVVAVVLASLLAAVLPADSVVLVRDLATVPNALPRLEAPGLSVTSALIVPALSLALVGLVQGAAISGSIPNPDGNYPDASTDFRGQGLANVLTGLFQGMPVAGSMSATALVKAAGARTALANLVAAIVMASTILLLGPVIGHIAMPALAGLLILVGFRTLKVHDLLMVWRTGPVQAVVLAVTFSLTLLIPLQYAVLTGVGLAIILHVARMSNRTEVRRWEFDKGSVLPRETDPPQQLASGEVVVLVTYGSLFFAAAPVFEAQLPQIPARCDRSVVIIRLRGKDELGSTFIKILEQYATKMHAAGGQLMLVGVSARVHDQLSVTGALATIGADRVFIAETRVGDSLAEAMDAAATWSSGHEQPPMGPVDG